MIPPHQILQSKLLDAYQNIEQLKLQNEYQQQQIHQLHQYIERLEKSLHYYQTISKRSQDQIRFLQGEPVRQQVSTVLPKNPFPQAKMTQKTNSYKAGKKLNNKSQEASKATKANKANKAKTPTSDNKNKNITKTANVLDYLNSK